MSSDIPFSFPIEVATLSTKGRHYKFAANAAQRDAVARALGLEALEDLSAELSVTPGSGRTYAVEGTITAKVVQACVVTLAPVPALIHEEISRRFAAAAHPLKEKVEPEEGWVDPEEDIVDSLDSDKLDLGEVVTEQLSLSLDPYPRAAGATFGGASSEDLEKGVEGPFAALAGLKAGKAAPRRGDRPPVRGKSRPPKRKT